MEFASVVIRETLLIVAEREKGRAGLTHAETLRLSIVTRRFGGLAKLLVAKFGLFERLDFLEERDGGVDVASLAELFDARHHVFDLY
jgi:hypothetical protein